VGEQTAPVTEAAPAVPENVKSEIQQAAKNGQSEPGKDTSAAPAGKVKTEKELERERKKAEKAKKFAEKQAKAATAKPAQPKAEKKEKIVEKTTDAYDPTVIEKGRYEWWQEKGLFKPHFDENGNTKPEGVFSMACPPPNVTGALHMGHALMVVSCESMSPALLVRVLNGYIFPGSPRHNDSLLPNEGENNHLGTGYRPCGHFDSECG
jgi:valyl-tRNA synthetase